VQHPLDRVRPLTRLSRQAGEEGLAYRSAKTVCTTLHDSTTLPRLSPASRLSAAPLLLPARMMTRPTASRLATLAVSRNTSVAARPGGVAGGQWTVNARLWVDSSLIVELGTTSLGFPYSALKS